jgi:oligosaccharide 4-alpha-D-glucosyltransferase
MRSLLFLVLSIVTTTAVFSQAGRPNSSYGPVSLTRYSANCYKITVASKLPRSEQVSDAVIAKPLQKQGELTLERLGPDSFRIVNFHDIVEDPRAFSFAIRATGDTRMFHIPLQEGQRVFGGGERALPLNRRGYRLNLNNNPWYGYGEVADNLNYSVPFISTSAGYGLFFDNPARSYIDIGKTDPSLIEWSAPSGSWSMYILLGDYQEQLTAYYKLTGTQPIPPRWAFGNLMSRFGYTSEAQVKDILAKMTAEKVPVEAVIFDLFWFGDSIKQTMGNLDWINRKKWPNPKGMIADFKKQGVKTILITEPFFVEASKNYKASKPYLATDSAGNVYSLKDFYFGKGGLVDIFRKDAQAWFWSYYRRQMQLGVEAWWGDLGEPEKHPSDVYHNLKDYGFSRRFQADEVHNIYGHTWTKMLYHYYAKEYPNKRLFSLNRSGFAGSPRYGIFPWTGDVSRSWGGLRGQLPTLLGMSMSGVPYVHSDAGGFAGPGGDNELYVRWLQFAVFTPIFRPHGTALYEVEPGAGSFPSEVALIDTPWRNFAREAINLRYYLLPYNYSLAYKQATEGAPLIAPLYFYFPGDTIAARIQDEYFWGENILVAPVLEKGATTRRVYLPEGQWLDGKGLLHEGKRWMTVPVTMESIPWFFRAGGIVPGQMTTPGTNTSNDKNASPFIVYIPSAKATKFDWYLDDGQSRNALSTGNYTLLRCQGVQKSNVITLQLTPTNQRYVKAKLLAQVGAIDDMPHEVRVNGKRVPLGRDQMMNTKSNAAYWDSKRQSVNVFLENGMKRAVTIEVIR